MGVKYYGFGHTYDPETGLAPQAALTIGEGFDEMGGKGSPGYREILDELWDLHLGKSGAYGSDGDPFLNFSVVAHATGDQPYLYPIARIQEKCVRVFQLHKQGRHEELDLLDIPSLGIIAEDLRRGPR